MMKKAIIVLSALTLVAPTAAVAEEVPKSIAIIDSGFYPEYIDNEIKEVCITAIAGCNNGKTFDDSVGASASKVKIANAYATDWKHGTIMASVANSINSNAKLILIRNARVLTNGAVFAGGPADLKLALDWVAANKNTYNISAVSFSRGQHTWVKTSKACPVDKTIQQSIVSLQSAGVPVVVASGNNGDKTSIDYPACIPEAVAISTSSKTLGIPSNNANVSNATDFLVGGTYNNKIQRVADSSSAATIAFASYWLKVSNGNFNDTYSKIKNSGFYVKVLDTTAVNVLQ